MPAAACELLSFSCEKNNGGLLAEGFEGASGSVRDRTPATPKRLYAKHFHFYLSLPFRWNILNRSVGLKCVDGIGM